MQKEHIEKVISLVKKRNGPRVWFDRLSTKITMATGTPIAFLTAIILIVAWGITGPIFKFSDTWQLVINTGTTIITFLMVFIIQQSQNKDTAALQIKLNELIACNEKASNRLIAVEDLTEDELRVLKKFYTKLSTLAEKEDDIHKSHSLDEASAFHKSKKRPERETGTK
jgi:low affinity Fe/Cu permease